MRKADDWWADIMARLVRRSKQVGEGRHGRHVAEYGTGLADAARRVVAEQPPFEPVMVPLRAPPPHVKGIAGPDGAWFVHPEEYRRLEREEKL